jgi:hypothetical protein
VNYGIAEMGYLDLVARAALPDTLRVGLFAGLALLTTWRFREWALPTALLYANALMMFKAHIAWDKYALPLLVVLWWLNGAMAEPAKWGRGGRAMES